ncbi:HPP family protein [Pacificoceanicola onchidii]|uniref:CBS domain-containing protein n=1 Tax=Pacificoceanicola onchidii TaxID=2562685 RepID=UPI0010A5E06E|nr:CBS domain-containing protein [Pacificoceanicola onchidii]
MPGRNLTCLDAMLPTDRQRTISPDATVFDAFHVLRESRARFLPVVEDNGTYRGVFTAPTLLSMLLPRAASISVTGNADKTNFDNLRFLTLDKSDLDAQIERLKEETVCEHMSDPENIPTTAPETPLMEAILMIYRYKRHVILVEPETNRFVGTVSANAIFDRILD